MSNEDTLQKGIELAQQGKFGPAASYFASLVRTDPNSEEGWFWLGLCCTDPKQREYCFRRVLTLNPGHEEAKEQLNVLLPTAPHPPPEDQSKSQPAEPLPPATPPTPQPGPVSPFIFDDQTAEASGSGSISGEAELTPFMDFSKAAQLTPSPTPEVAAAVPAAPQAITPSPIVPVPATSPAAQAAPPRTPPPPAPGAVQPRRKQPNWFLLFFLFLLALLIISGLAIAYLYLTGRLAGLIPLGLAGPSSPALLLSPLASLPAVPTVTLTLLPATASSNPATDTPSLLPTARPTIAYTPVYASTTCPFEPPKEAVVNCGTVTVPEDRTDPNSKTIQLAVVVFHSLSSNPAPDPVIFLQGGPGAGAIQVISEHYTDLVKPFLSTRDFITFDQRGTGYSKPVLECGDLTNTYKQDIHGQIPVDSRNLLYSNAFLSCHDAMTVQGIDLNAYTTVASAADLRDIVSVLNYNQVDLYGASYGTRLAQVVMRDQPDIVHSAVVDSVLPIETKFYNENPAGVESSLRALFDTCASEPACQTAYPQLETTFWQLVDQLNAKPVSVTGPVITGGTITEEVDGSTFMNTIVGMLEESLIAPAAQAIYQIQGGDYSVLIAAQYSEPNTFEDIAPGLFISIMCHENILATTPQDLQAALAANPHFNNYSWLPFYGGVDGLFKTCKIWQAQPPAPGENDPVTSSIPTLIIAGKYDPTTPPSWANQLVGHLSHNYLFVFPDNGHTPTTADPSGCALGMVIAFLNDPTQSPDHSCLDKMKEVQFIVPYTGTPPVNLTATQGSGINYKGPTDWESNGDGIYSRKESPLDFTQLGVFTTTLTSTELLDSLSSKLYDYGGLDAAPIQSGTHAANGLTWDLYQTTSYGRPVDLAMAASGKETLVVLMFSHAEEHQALSQTVYLPVIDSAVPTP